MSSRAEEKRQAREQREAAERQADAARRKRTIGLAGGAGVLAVIVVVALILLSQGGSDSDGGSEATTLFNGIEQRGIALGDPDAPVTMVEFADLQCPFCADYSREVLPDLVEQYVRPGDVRMELRLISIIGPESQHGALVAGAAAEQDGIWPFAEQVFANQEREGSGYMTTDFLREQAEAAGLDAERAIAASEERPAQDYVDESVKLARQSAIQSTPSFLIGPTGGKLEPLEFSALETSEFESAIDAALAQAGK